MEVLYWFKAIRDMEGTGLLTHFFSFVTYLGHELIPIALICILYWCANKRLAYKIGFSFFLSGLLTQCLKITFRVERPWIKDPNFTPVESAVNEATSYSFPSGHTQAATSVYSSLALSFKRNWLRIICVAIFIVVGISRMYLGVHTFYDVAASMILTLIITLFVFSFTDKVFDNRKCDIWISAIMIIFSAFTVIYAVTLESRSVISLDAASDCVKSGSAGLAFAIGYFVERRYINFDTKAPLWLQIIKVAVGLGVALALKSGLKLILGESLLGDAIRYFVLVGFIVIVYPLLFKLIKK